MIFCFETTHQNKSNSSEIVGYNLDLTIVFIVCYYFDITIVLTFYSTVNKVLFCESTVEKY